MLDRVRADVEDGVALGVGGTPTFFVGGEPVQPATVEDFHTALDGALAAS